MAARVNFSSLTLNQSNNHYVKVSNEIITGSMSSQCKSLLLFLLLRKNITEHKPSYLKAKLGWSIKNLTYALREAEQMGYISIISQREANGRFDYNSIRVNADFFCADKNFTIIPRKLLETRLLTWLEKLINCYFYVRSNMEAWKFRNDDIRNIFKVGKNKLHKCLVKLKSLGYLLYRVIKNAYKKIIGSENFLNPKMKWSKGTDSALRVDQFRDSYKGVMTKNNTTILVSTNNLPLTPSESSPEELVLFLRDKKIPEIDKNLSNLISKFGLHSTVKAITYAAGRFTHNLWGYAAEALRKNWKLEEKTMEYHKYPNTYPVSNPAPKSIEPIRQFTDEQLNASRERWKGASPDTRKSWADKVSLICSAFRWQIEGKNVESEDFCTTYLFKMGLESLNF